jgi:hypothetical protein
MKLKTSLKLLPTSQIKQMLSIKYHQKLRELDIFDEDTEFNIYLKDQYVTCINKIKANANIEPVTNMNELPAEKYVKLDKLYNFIQYHKNIIKKIV